MSRTIWHHCFLLSNKWWFIGKYVLTHLGVWSSIGIEWDIPVVVPIRKVIRFQFATQFDDVETSASTLHRPFNSICYFCIQLCRTSMCMRRAYCSETIWYDPTHAMACMFDGGNVVVEETCLCKTHASNFHRCLLILYIIILLTENAQKRGWLAFPCLDTWNTLSRHPKTVRIFNAWEGVPSNKARKGQYTPFLGVCI